MKVRSSLLALILTVSLLAPATAALAAPTPAPQAGGGGFTIPINVTDPAQGSFVGSLTITAFRVVNNALVAVGRVTGTLTDENGDVVGIIRNVLLPIIGQPAGTCEILHLELGPLDLNLLGLVVHLDRVVLDITAESGPGNLLGNLLCAVARLLDSNGALSAIANLLNQILGQL